MFPIRDHNPSGRTPYVTWALMALNIGIFLSYWPFIGSDENALLEFWAAYAMVPGWVTKYGTYETLFTSMFLHGGWMHLAGNMLFLWIFGDNMEDEMGHVPYLLFYFAGGLGAGLTHVVSAPGSMVPTVGASGAIAAVMGGYLLMFPRARVDILLILIVYFRVFPVPAWIMLGLWFGLQLFNGVGADPDGGGVAYWAHAGGFVIGIFLTLPLFFKRGGMVFWAATHGHPPHPDAEYPFAETSIPRVGRRRE